MDNLSKFNLDNEVKTSFELGDLIPFQWLDVVPGDEIRTNTNALIRLQPLIAPVMHRLDLYTRYYYVPYRLLIPNFEKMLIKPDDDSLKVKTLYDAGVSSDNNLLNEYNLLRAFGVHSSSGTLTTQALKKISVLPFYAYQLVYNYFYKDPVIDETYKDVFDNDVDFDDVGIFDIRRVNYFRDYYTSVLPTTQYGSAVDLDMDNNNVIHVNEMRLAEALQRFKEKLLLRGTRYIDFLKNFFGTSPSTEVLQQPQYLGGGRSSLNISDVDQLVPTETSPMGSTAGKSVSVVSENGYQYSVKEHGIILGLCFVLPRQSYISGIPRSFIKHDFYSFYNPSFAAIGMQETYGCELDANRTDTFGYNERYAELKYNNDVIAGDLSESLDFWHFGRDIRSEHLSKDFLRALPTTRPFAVQQFNFPTPHVDQNKIVIQFGYYDIGEEAIGLNDPRIGYALRIGFKDCLYPDTTDIDAGYHTKGSLDFWKPIFTVSADDWMPVLSHSLPKYSDVDLGTSANGLFNNATLLTFVRSDDNDFWKNLENTINTSQYAIPFPAFFAWNDKDFVLDAYTRWKDLYSSNPMSSFWMLHELPRYYDVTYWNYTKRPHYITMFQCPEPNNSKLFIEVPLTMPFRLKDHQNVLHPVFEKIRGDKDDYSFGELAEYAKTVKSPENFVFGVMELDARRNNGEIVHNIKGPRAPLDMAYDPHADFAPDIRNRVFNHCLAVFYNNVDALRPIPKLERNLL